MSQLNEQLDSLQQKIQQLLKQHQLLQKDHMRLHKELEKKEALLKESEQKIQQLQQHADAVSVGTQVLDTDQKKALNKRIDGYLKEIDHCLSLLNQ
jgi:chromosome segregation ATPase